MDKLVQELCSGKVPLMWLIVLAPCILGCVIYYYLLKLPRTKQGQQDLTVSEIYIYPIKSLRPVKLQEATATKHGFQHDRRFLLLKKDPKEQSGYIHMAVSRYPEMTQFLQDIKGNMLTITYTAYGNTANSRIITLPLIPDTAKLDSFNVNMHDSPTSAFKMPEEYSTWFSACFGYEVLLVYLGENRRGVLFEDMLPKPKPFNPITSFLSIVLGRKATQENWEITFADCAPYLITSHTSLQDVSARLSSSPNSTTTSSTTSENPEAMDPTKFRPNLILHGAHTPWAEDFWTRLRLHGPGAEILLTHNCVRCSSINIDYATGKAGTGPAGQVLKKLQKDRRVDAGAKWSPVFGRYGFLVGREGVGEQKGEGMEGVAVRVGERVSVLEVSERRTVWSWPNLS